MPMNNSIPPSESTSSKDSSSQAPFRRYSVINTMTGTGDSIGCRRLNSGSHSRTSHHSKLRMELPPATANRSKHMMKCKMMRMTAATRGTTTGHDCVASCEALATCSIDIAIVTMSATTVRTKWKKCGNCHSSDTSRSSSSGNLRREEKVWALAGIVVEHRDQCIQQVSGICHSCSILTQASTICSSNWRLAHSCKTCPTRN